MRMGNAFLIVLYECVCVLGFQSLSTRWNHSPSPTCCIVTVTICFYYLAEQQLVAFPFSAYQLPSDAYYQCECVVITWLRFVFLLRKVGRPQDLASNTSKENVRNVTFFFRFRFHSVSIWLGLALVLCPCFRFLFLLTFTLFLFFASSSGS